MKNTNVYNVIELSYSEQLTIGGGDGIIKRFGKWLGETWKDANCGCGGEPYEPKWDLLNGPKL